VRRTSRWVSLFRGLPTDLLTADVPTWIEAGDSERLIAFLEAKCQDAFDEERAFRDQHPEARDLAKDRFRPLTGDETAQLEWFMNEQAKREERTQLLLHCLRDAKDIAGLAPRKKTDSDDVLGEGE
jgi:hypothetical protein